MRSITDHAIKGQTDAEHNINKNRKKNDVKRRTKDKEKAQPLLLVAWLLAIINSGFARLKS